MLRKFVGEGVAARLQVWERTRLFELREELLAKFGPSESPFGKIPKGHSHHGRYHFRELKGSVHGAHAVYRL